MRFEMIYKQSGHFDIISSVYVMWNTHVKGPLNLHGHSSFVYHCRTPEKPLLEFTSIILNIS